MSDWILNSKASFFPPVPILACGDDDCKIHLFVQQNDQVIDDVYEETDISFCLITFLNADYFQIIEFQECSHLNQNNPIGVFLIQFFVRWFPTKQLLPWLPDPGLLEGNRSLGGGRRGGKYCGSVFSLKF